MFPKNQNEMKRLIIDAYSDSSFADIIDDRSSSYGFVVRANGTSISWRSKKTPQICRSSCEAEYHAMAECARELKFIDNLLQEIAIPYEHPLLLKTDSQPALTIAKVPRVNQRTKHIEILDHYIRYAIRTDVVIVKWVPSAENIADIFTKPLGTQKLNPMRDVLTQKK